MKKILIIIILLSLVGCNSLRKAQNKMKNLLDRFPELVDTKKVTRYDTVKFLEIYKRDSVVLAMDESKFDSLLFAFVQLSKDIDKAYREKPETIISSPDNSRIFNRLNEVREQYNSMLAELRKGAFKDTLIRSEDEHGYLEVVFKKGTIDFSYKVFEKYKIVPVEEITTTIDLKRKITTGEILLLILIIFLILNLLLNKK